MGDPALVGGAFFDVQNKPQAEWKADTVWMAPANAVPGAMKASAEAMMHAWYRTRARETFERRMQRLIDRTPALRLTEPPPLIVRTIRTRWGSCSPSGRILMNVESVKLPIGCLDYVLMHELCHLRHNDHSRKFWRHLDRCMPGWERWRRKLDRVEI